MIGIFSVEEILQILTWQLGFASGTFFFWVDVPNVSFSQVFLILHPNNQWKQVKRTRAITKILFSFFGGIWVREYCVLSL